MIRMIKGTYGRLVNGEVEAMTKNSEPFKLSKAREAELVAAGVAVMVEAVKDQDATPEPEAVDEELTGEL